MRADLVDPRRWLLGIAAAGLLLLLLLSSPVAAQESDDESLPEAAPALDYQRDPTPLLTDPVETWSLAFSAHDEFLAAGGGGSASDLNPGQVRVWDFEAVVRQPCGPRLQ